MPVTERHAHVTAGVVSLRGEGVADVFRRGEGPGPQLPLKPLLRHHESVLDSAIVTPSMEDVIRPLLSNHGSTKCHVIIFFADANAKNCIWCFPLAMSSNSSIVRPNVQGGSVTSMLLYKMNSE